MSLQPALELLATLPAPSTAAALPSSRAASRGASIPTRAGAGSLFAPVRSPVPLRCGTCRAEASLAPSGGRSRRSEPGACSTRAEGAVGRAADPLVEAGADLLPRVGRTSRPTERTPRSPRSASDGSRPSPSATGWVCSCSGSASATAGSVPASAEGDGGAAAGAGGSEEPAGAGAGAGCAIGAGAGCAIGAGAGAGGAAGAGGGLVVSRDGSRESGSTYRSSPTRTPRWTYGTSCSGSPDGPGSETASPSSTRAPFFTTRGPRWVSDTRCPSDVVMVTVSPWVGTVPANVTSPLAGARTARAPPSSTSIPRCCPAAYLSSATEKGRRTAPSAGQVQARACCGAASTTTNGARPTSTRRVFRRENTPRR